MPALAMEPMSQKNVQVVVGRLLTDEEFRLRFLEQPLEALTALLDQGFDLTMGEVEALMRTDPVMWIEAAERIDPRLQRCRLNGD